MSEAMGKEAKHTKFGSKLINRIEAVRDYYQGKGKDRVRFRTRNSVK